MIDQSAVNAATECISAALDGRKPVCAVILGSGLRDAISQMRILACIPYSSLPGFPIPKVAGHGGDVMIAELVGVVILVLTGRAHYYEQGDMCAMAMPIATVHALGCSFIMFTNAAGAINADMRPGQLMIINDHINFVGQTPLIGVGGSDPFVPMDNAYDAVLQQQLSEAAESVHIAIHRGVYIWFAGPSFETPAEIRAARILGADAVGMSTVPEVILARYYGLSVAAISVITNMAAGMTSEVLSHQQALSIGSRAVFDFVTIFSAFLARRYATA